VPLIVWALSAFAAPVVWLDAPLGADEQAAAGLIGVDRSFTVATLAAERLDAEAVDTAYERLERTLQQVRAYETKLDGELIIMADLQAAIDTIPAVRDEKDREALFRALAYQGFAVDRYFADTLATDPEAGPWRVELADEPSVRPWVDAAALHPEREVTAYDISEAPQRVAFERVRARSTSALPGGVRVDLPAGHALRVDGTVRPTEGAVVRVAPGRHHLQVEADGVVLSTSQLDLRSGDTLPLTVELTLDRLEAFLRTATPETGVPTAIGELAEAVGGEVWVVRRREAGLDVVAIRPSGVSPVQLTPVKPTRERSTSTTDGLSFALSLSAGWLASGDFYASQPDVAPHSRATVNAIGLGVGGSVAFDSGLFRAAVGLDAVSTLGEHHVALSGDRAYRVRPLPHLFVGTRYGGVVAGFLLPYHPLVGARLSVPVTDGLSWTTDAQFGVPGSVPRADGSSYQTLPVQTVRTGLTLRLRP
jgi:hypothetical protein